MLSPPLHIATQASPQYNNDIKIDHLNHIMDRITNILIIKDQQINNAKIIKELIKLNNTKPIQPSPYRLITSIKFQLNKHINPLLSLNISKPNPIFINNLKNSQHYNSKQIL